MTKKHISEFPSVSEIQEKVENNPLLEAPEPKKVNKTTRWLARWLIAALAVLVLSLTAFRYLRSPSGQLMLGSGGVTGLAVNTDQQPVQAEVFIPGSDYSAQAGSDGLFELGNIPAGLQSVVIAYDGIGYEIRVEIEAGKTVNIGTIKLETTQVPP